MQYRREIDGLRAVAVVPVILGHARFPGFSGGYVGVDIFFVISGFLITRIIMDEISQGSFLFAKFYERRARRILPALFVVLACCIPPAILLMGVDHLENFGQSVVATVLFSNNILLTLTSNYWDLESEFKPLLHTWTLGVEEQYYLIVPLFLVAVFKVRQSFVRPAIIIIGVGSFILAVALLSGHEAASFFLLPTRAWELAVGGLIATVRPQFSPRAAAALSCAGLLAIAIAVVTFGSRTATPSGFTLLPVIGAALVILFAQGGAAHWFLSSRPMVLVGLLSYSAYLWHQPLFAFARIASATEPSFATFALLTALTFPLSYVSWRFVETPFRNRQRVSGPQLGAVLVGTSIALVGAGACMHFSEGWPNRFEQPADAVPITDYIAYNSAVNRLRKPAFSSSSDKRLLVLGVSTARDFVNLVTESQAFPGHEIVYRDDLDLCEMRGLATADTKLVEQATVIVSVHQAQWGRTCDAREVVKSAPFGQKLLFVGPINFGANMNPFFRVPLAERQTALTEIAPQFLIANARFKTITPADRYIDLIAIMSPDGRRIRVFDDDGQFLSVDRIHLTRAGAKFVGQQMLHCDTFRRATKAAGAPGRTGC